MQSMYSARSMVSRQWKRGLYMYQFTSSPSLSWCPNKQPSAISCLEPESGSLGNSKMLPLIEIEEGRFALDFLKCIQWADLYRPVLLCLLSLGL